MKKKNKKRTLKDAINATKEVPHFPTLTHDDKKNKKRLLDKARNLAEKENNE